MKKDNQRLQAEIEELRIRLEEAEEMLSAIRNGEVDALVVSSGEGDKVFTLEGADQPYRVLVETMSEGAATLNPDSSVLFCNSRLTQMLGTPLERILGKPLISHVAPADTSMLSDLLERSLSEHCRLGEAFRAELALLTEKGDSVPVLLSCCALNLEGSRGISVIVTDLSEQKRNEAIVADGELASSILEQAGETIIVCDESGRVIRASRQARELFGANPICRPFDELGRLEEESTGRPFSISATLGGQIFRALEVKLQRHDRQLHLHLNARLLLRKLEILGCVVTLTDITERKQAEEALRVSEERFRVAVKNSAFIPSQTDNELRYCWIYNPHPDFDASAVIGKRDLEIDDSTGAHALQELKQRVLASGCGERETIEFQRSDDTRIYDFIVEPLYDSSLKVDGLTCTAFDVTEKKRAEKELERAKKAAEEANRAKSEFLANMSHEIRTPMTVFMSAIEELLQLNENPEERQLLGMADRSARRLRRLIDDILDVSRIEARQFELEEEPFDLPVCVRDAVEIFSHLGREKNLRLETEIAPETPHIVVGDPNRLGQVLINLVGNAVKFTDQGEIRVSVRPRGDLLEIVVADTGVGIPEEKRTQIFQEFQQLDSSFNRRFGGTGLGLTISKGLVELMGGELSVQSREGEGSVFTFTVCLKTAEKQSLASAPASAAPKGSETEKPAARILLAEDDPMIRQIFSMMLAKQGWQAETAESGKEAVEKTVGGDFDIILMDLQMPEMSGIEATRVIRERELQGGKRAYIIGLTAHAHQKVHEECLASGMDKVLTKPIQMKDLILALEDSCS